MPLKICSDPSGAEVYINEKYRSITPLDLLLNEGTYKLKIKKEGYKPYLEKITIRKGDSEPINIILEPETPPQFGILSIGSNPADAVAYLNGEYKGQTPLRLRLNAGNYEVKITK